MSNIAVTHAESGLVHAEVTRSERVSPHVVRVTLGGADLERFAFQGFDQWVRLAIPAHAGDRFDDLPQRFGIGGFVKYALLARGTRPVIRNYTIRQYRSSPAEVDIDFVVHGTEGVAAPWAESTQAGDEVAFIDQGCGFEHRPGSPVLLVADETGMPAVAGILRDLPRDATGLALVELFDERDRQPVEAPPGVAVQWLTRSVDHAPGAAVLPALAAAGFDPTVTTAFAVGESAVATGARRHLVRDRRVPTGSVTFCGYWKRRTATSG